jgi:hypothetical protein
MAKGCVVCVVREEVEEVLLCVLDELGCVVGSGADVGEVVGSEVVLWL